MTQPTTLLDCVTVIFTNRHPSAKNQYIESSHLIGGVMTPPYNTK